MRLDVDAHEHVVTGKLAPSDDLRHSTSSSIPRRRSFPQHLCCGKSSTHLGCLRRRKPGPESVESAHTLFPGHTLRRDQQPLAQVHAAAVANLTTNDRLAERGMETMTSPVCSSKCQDAPERVTLTAPARGISLSSTRMRPTGRWTPWKRNA